MRIGFGLVAMAIGALVTTGASAQDLVDGPKVNWKVAVWGKSRPFTVNADVMKKHVEARTGGKFSITVGYEVFGGAKEYPDLVKIGSVQAAMVTPSYYPDRMPVHSVFDLPFLPFGNLDNYARTVDAFAKFAPAQKELHGWGARYLVATLIEPYKFMGRGKAPKTLQDFKGLRVRALGGQGDAMRRLGAVPTSMDATEVYTAIERGTIDAAAFPGTSSHAAYRIYEVSKWFADGLELGAGTAPIIANEEAYNALPEQYRKVLDEVPAVAYAEYKKTYAAADEKNVPLFKSKKVEFVEYTPAELAEFRKVGAEPVWEDWIARQEARGIPGREVLNFVLKTAKGE